MKKINLQKITKPLKGKMIPYWFENKKAGINKTLFYMIEIPLEPFDTGFLDEESDEDQPTSTKIIMEWIDLAKLESIEGKDIKLSSGTQPDIETSIYLGSRHNPCDIKKLTLSKISKTKYQVRAELFINFEHEMVAKDESFEFLTEVTLKN